jgi:DNA-directed RNA polymerase III subunit RPC2
MQTETQEDGIVDVGQKLKKEDILVNRCIQVHEPGQEKEAENGVEPRILPRPIRYASSNPGSASRVLLTNNGHHSMMVKVMTDQTRIPEVGDKFSSRHGQKGVVGIKIAQSDMPFTEQGIVPDIIMNPHGFPSRMTVGKLLELLCGKAGTLDGRYLDSSAFADKEICRACLNDSKSKKKKMNKLDLNRLYSEKCSCKDVAFNIGEILKKYGFNFNGEDAMISGTTGEYIKSYIFTGPVYYQRLKHLVADKIHARAQGKKTFLTRQPLEGRAKDGGLRLGEMERDCLLAYGASEVLFERFLIASDDYTCLICEACGIIGCQGNCHQSQQKGKHTLCFNWKGEPRT